MLVKVVREIPVSLDKVVILIKRFPRIADNLLVIIINVSSIQSGNRSVL